MAMAYKGGPGDKRGLEHCRTGDPMYPDGMGHHLRGQGGMNYTCSLSVERSVQYRGPEHGHGLS